LSFIYCCYGLSLRLRKRVVRVARYGSRARHDGRARRRRRSAGCPRFRSAGCARRVASFNWRNRRRFVEWHAPLRGDVRTGLRGCGFGWIARGCGSRPTGEPIRACACGFRLSGADPIPYPLSRHETFLHCRRRCLRGRRRCSLHCGRRPCAPDRCRQPLPRRAVCRVCNVCGRACVWRRCRACGWSPPMTYRLERFCGAAHGWLPLPYAPSVLCRAEWRLRLLRAVDGDRFIFRLSPVQP